MKTDPLLQTCTLGVGYGKKQILSHVDLCFFAGEFVCLLGPNGAGKTTLLRTLSGHLAPLEGKVILDGRDLSSLKSGQLARRMSVVLTVKTMPALFRVYDFVAMGRYPHTAWTGRLAEHDDAVVMEALALVGAEDLAFRDISRLSDGERQKVLIARALAQEPDIMLLDEPTMHLDLRHRMQIMGILQTLCREKGICVAASLHDVETAARVADRVALVKDGGIKAFGPPEQVMDKDAVSFLYDFTNAGFDPVLGSIEISMPPCTGIKVFVIGGMGSASVLFRLLVRKGFEVVAGVLLKNDIDCFVARSLGINCIVQDTVLGDGIEQACEMFDSCDFVIDAGFEFNDLTMHGMDLICRALESGKTLVCLGRDRKKIMEEIMQAGAGEIRGSDIVYCDDETCVAGILEEKVREDKTGTV
jgi:iron complex transport system ATP-binding protein